MGKSSLLLRYVDDTFSPEPVTSLGVDFKAKTIDLKVKNAKGVEETKKVKIQIWDTMGQERFRTITSSYYRGAQGILIVYDMTDEQSISNVKTWLSECDRYASDQVTKVLVGNKMDLSDERKKEVENDMKNAVSSEVAFHLETSAKTKENVEELFEQLCRIIVERVTQRDQATMLAPPSAAQKKGGCCTIV